MRRKTVLIIMSGILITTLCIPQNPLQADVSELFWIALLSPNTSEVRNQWAQLMETELPKTGIGVYHHESTGWANISTRLWAYPLIDYDHIPTYAAGGYDIFFGGWSWGIDWDPTGLFDSSAIVPYGDNFYQYNNPAYDAKLIQYLNEMDQSKQIEYAKELQAMLYEDLPSIVLIYPNYLFGFKEGLTDIDTFLFSVANTRYEFWDDSDDHIIKYAIPADLKEWNIFVVDSFYDAQWMQGVYGALYQRQQHSRLWQPQIANGFPIFSSDRKNITVNIDPNAKFSDGSPVLAEDIAYTIHLHMDPSVGSSDFSYYNHWFGSTSSIYAVDADTIQFNLTDVNAFPLNIISFGIIDKSVIEPLISTYGYSIFNQVPGTGDVGWDLVKSAGPFKVDIYDSVNSTVKLVPNTYYADLAGYGAPLLNELNFTFILGKDAAVAELIAGNVDIVDSQYYPVFADFAPAGFESVLVSQPNYQEMAINMKHPIFGTGELTFVGTPTAAKYIRKAISHVVPRDYIVENILEGIGSPGIVPVIENSYCFNDSLEPYEYNITLAQEYMELAGYSVIIINEFNNLGILLVSTVGVCIVTLLARRKKIK